MALPCKDVQGNKELCIIGAGALGSRHLQAMAPLSEVNITIVDPSADALALAKERWNAVDSNNCVRFLSGLPAGYKHYDLVVIATSSKPRFQVLEQLLLNNHVSAVILEKVLFTKMSEYVAAAALLQKYNVPAWVNCTRRAFKVYQQIKAKLPADALLQARVFGGEWGLGCNSIHFIDLISFLSDDTAIASIDSAGLAPGWKQAKRPEYVEFSGVMTVNFAGGSTLELVALPTQQRHIIEIRVAEQVFIIDEVMSQLVEFCTTTQSWQTQTFVLPPTSCSMTGIYRQVLLENCCTLPTFSHSSRLHTPVIAALSTHMAGNFSAEGYCPIT